LHFQRPGLADWDLQDMQAQVCNLLKVLRPCANPLQSFSMRSAYWLKKTADQQIYASKLRDFCISNGQA